MSHEILTNAEMGRADAFAVAHGVPSLVLMENAGQAVADAIAAASNLVRSRSCAGQATMAATALLWRVCWTNMALPCAWPMTPSRKATPPSCRSKWKGTRVALAPEALDGAKLVVDGLFGAGLSRPLEGAYAQVVEALNDLPVVAIDVPSGLSGDTGQALGGVVVRAVLTVTFFRKKPGHLLLPGRVLCGETVVADIGIPPEAAGTQLHENTPALWRYPWPRPEGHKYSRGHCVVVSGPAHATGAARLAARAALRVGAGLVSVASPPDAVAVNAAHLTAIMVKPFDGARGLTHLLTDKRFNAVALGSGTWAWALKPANWWMRR